MTEATTSLTFSGIKRSASGTQTYQQNGSTEAANATEVRPDFLNISVAEAEVFVNLVL